MYYILALGARMASLSFSLCKHGPRCKWRAKEECFFAHSIDEISYPLKISAPGLWLDTSDSFKGHSAPDLFVGQEYSCAQMARVLAYLKTSHQPYPSWVNLYLWFLRHPRYVPDNQLDLGWTHSLKVLGIVAKSSDASCIEIIESGVLSSWRVGWRFSTDMLGIGFIKRMKKRLTQAVEYPVFMAVRSFYQANEYQEKTSMHWGEYSRDYVNIRYGDKMVLVNTTVGSFKGWAWIVKYPQIRIYGWVPLDHLVDTKERIYLEDVVISASLPQLSETAIETTLQTPRPLELHRLYDDEGNLSATGELAICASDGSADEGEGVGAATMCNFPDESGGWVKTAIAAKMFAHGATAAEIIGVILTLHTLKQRLDSFKTALVCTDCASCLRYFEEYVEPTDESGWKLYPLITLARAQLLYLHNMQKTIIIKKIPREHNPAHDDAKDIMQKEREIGWPLLKGDPLIQSIPQLWESIRMVDDYSMRVVRGEWIPRLLTF